MSASCWI